MSPDSFWRSPSQWLFNTCISSFYSGTSFTCLLFYSPTSLQCCQISKCWAACLEIMRWSNSSTRLQQYYRRWPPSLQWCILKTWTWMARSFSLSSISRLASIFWKRIISVNGEQIHRLTSFSQRKSGDCSYLNQFAGERSPKRQIISSPSRTLAAIQFANENASMVQQLLWLQSPMTIAKPCAHACDWPIYKCGYRSNLISHRR